jgi:hypothetical protein
VKRLVALGGLVALAIVAAGCGGGGDESVKAQNSSSSSSSTTSTTSSTTTTAPPAAPTTLATLCTTPDEATRALYQAWTDGDQAAAARCAEPGAVTTIFENSGAGNTWMFQGCGGPDPGVPTCQYSYEGGAATFTLNGTEASGWKVVSVSYIAD